MMMTKPQEKPATNNAAATTAKNSNKTGSPPDAVADLERRLAQLASDSLTTMSSTSTNTTTTAAAVTTMPPQPAAATHAFAGAPVKGGKNALLARIMAAQDRAKQGTAAPAAVSAPATSTKDVPPPSYDDNADLLLMELDNTTDNDSKPPAFDITLLPPPVHEQPPPPVFDDTLLPPPASASAASMNNPVLQWDPHAPQQQEPQQQSSPAPSAPCFDLLSHSTSSEEASKMPPPMQAPTTALDDSAVEAILGIPGLSDEEKRQLIAEQEKILASIEKTKLSSAASRADAFEQRAFSNAVQAVGSHSKIRTRGETTTTSSTTVAAVQLGDESMQLQGQEETRAAIANNTAVVALCLACENYMQVPQEATLMLCPICQTVTPVVLAEDGGTGSATEAKQMMSDLELAEQLQKEEYKAAERAERRQRTAATTSTTATAGGGTQPKDGQSWMEWLGLSSAATSAASSPERPTSFAQAPAVRGHLGASRPPGAGSGLTAAQTETISFSRSGDNEDAALLRSTGSGSPARSPARMAERQPMFNCVADSITSAATSFTTALNTHHLSEDAEGNVHGVDSSSLLAVPTIRREHHNAKEGE